MQATNSAASMEPIPSYELLADKHSSPLGSSPGCSELDDRTKMLLKKTGFSMTQFYEYMVCCSISSEFGDPTCFIEAMNDKNHTII